ncbi:gamma-glutamylcyclotransferase [Yoonia sp. SS1-5]|uniref:glutathione-specific gamma-glutamylcyclotransferase n=1 Tax=Yoonia rhodophyticola TaxID=3137370 RepID=A0AAN0MAK9_9RHOB
MNDPAFFGYGSLVNLDTHDYADPRPAKLHGWRREWRHTDLRDLAFLSVRQDADSVIAGVAAKVPGGDWSSLDLRETGYRRHDVTDQLSVDGHRAVTAVYQVDPTYGVPPEPQGILLSYLDVVVQGFYRLYGASGVSDFFATTDGWQAPIIDDRAEPRYPRHRILSAEERSLVDRHLMQVGAC